MNRYRIVVRSYPPHYRARYGDELTDTAVAFHPERWSLRQAWSLLVGGFRTRASHATRRSPRNAWAAGIRLAVILHLIVQVSGRLAVEGGAVRDVSSDGLPGMLTIVGLLWVVAALSWSTRWPSALLFSVVLSGSAIRALMIGSDPRAFQPQLNLSIIATTITLLAVTWWLATATDGRRALHPVTTALMLTASTVAGFIRNDPGSGLAIATIFIALVTLTILGFTIDPRPAITLAALATLVAIRALPFLTLTTDPIIAVWGLVALGLLFLATKSTSKTLAM